MQSAVMMSKLLALVLVAAVLVCISSAASIEQICQMRCLSGQGGGNLCNCAAPPFQGKRSDGPDTWRLHQQEPGFAAPQDQNDVLFRSPQDASLDSDRRQLISKILRSLFE